MMFVGRFIENNQDFFQAESEIHKYYCHDKDHPTFYPIDPMLKKFMQEFYAKFNYDPVDIFIQYVFAIAAKHEPWSMARGRRPYWHPDVIEFDKNWSDIRLKELMTGVLVRQESKSKSQQIRELPNLYTADILGSSGDGTWEFKDAGTLVICINGLIRKVIVASKKSDKEIAELAEDIKVGRRCLYLEDFDARGNYAKEEITLSNEFKDAYLTDPQSTGKTNPLLKEELYARRNPVEKTDPNLSSPVSVQTPAQPESPWVISFLIKAALSLAMALICLGALNYVFMRVSMSRVEAAFDNSVFK